MTVSGIMLKCDTTGIPTPHITWTSGDTGDIVGTGKYYQVPYVKCATKALRFYCHARNPMGNISSPEIHVKGKGAFMGYMMDSVYLTRSSFYLSYIDLLRLTIPSHTHTCIGFSILIHLILQIIFLFIISLILSLSLNLPLTLSFVYLFASFFFPLFAILSISNIFLFKQTPYLRFNFRFSDDCAQLQYSRQRYVHRSCSGF